MTNCVSKSLLAALVLMCCSGDIAGANGFFNTNWQTSNLSMKTVPSEFNSFYRLVGLSVQPPRINLLFNTSKFTKDDSDFFPMSAGPYGNKTVLEVQYTADRKNIRRFRFVQKNDNNGTKCLEYSEWQADVQPNSETIDRCRPDPNHLTEMDEPFDRQKWLLIGMDRMKETWDFLHSRSIVGMTRKQTLEQLGPASKSIGNIDYYQLSGGASMSPTVYLEFQYLNERVSAFRTEEIMD